MSRKSIPVLCYWGGRISHGSQGITYENANPKAIKVNRGIQHSELIDKMYNLSGIDKKYKLKIICRYLANGQYVALPIDNDGSVDIMLDMTKEKGINCVELYIQKSYVFIDSQSDIRLTENDGGNEGATRDPAYVHFKARTMTGKEISCRMKPDTPLWKLMAAFCERQEYGECRLLYGGRQLEAGRTLNEYHICDGAVIHVVERLRGD